jgi:hypothetical protein
MAVVTLDDLSDGRGQLGLSVGHHPWNDLARSSSASGTSFFASTNAGPKARMRPAGIRKIVDSGGALSIGVTAAVDACPPAEAHRARNNERSFGVESE